MTDKDAKLIQAENLLKQNQHSRAIKILKEVYKKNSSEESILLKLAWAYYDSGDIKKAIGCFRELFERELPRKVFAGFAFDELVRIYKQEKDFCSLVEICQRAVASQPDDINLLMELVNAYLLTGRSQEACAVCEKMLNLESDNSAIYCLWGNALFTAGLFAESERAYSRAARIDLEQEDYYLFKLAILFQEAENHKEAIRIVRKCIAENPDNPLYYCFWGDSLIGLNQIKEACRIYDQAVQCGERKDTGAYYNRLGNSLMKARRFSEAALSFRKALEQETNPAYYNNLISACRAIEHEDGTQKPSN